MLDYDGYIVENTKPDNAFAYKRTEGYYTAGCSIGKLLVYIPNSGGDTPESYGQLPIISKAIENCRKHCITIGSFRSDACYYEKNAI